MTENEPTTQGLTRRELLKRGAVVGGALVWATPVVQLIGMQPAQASHVSDLCICVKFDGSDDEFDHWTTIGNPGQGRCLPDPLPTGCQNFIPDDTFLTGNCLGEEDKFCLEKNNGTWTLYYPLYCTLEEAWAKCGNDCCDLLESSTTITFSDNGVVNIAEINDTCPCSDKGQSHFEFCFRC